MLLPHNTAIAYFVSTIICIQPTYEYMLKGLSYRPVPAGIINRFSRVSTNPCGWTTDNERVFCVPLYSILRLSRA